MPKFLNVANKLLSLRGAITLSDEHDQQVFEAKGEFAFLSPTWRLYKGSAQVASIRKRIWAWSRTWDIESVLGDFVIKRKLWSWTPQFQVNGGSFDGAAMSGSLFDLNTEVELRGKLIAKVRGKILTLRDRHTVELLDQSDEGVLFTAIAMVVMQLDRRASSGGGDGGDGGD
jgi:uncharacterized protein YxjI